MTLTTPNFGNFYNKKDNKRQTGRIHNFYDGGSNTEKLAVFVNGMFKC